MRIRYASVQPNFTPKALTPDRAVGLMGLMITAERASTGPMVASGGALSDGYGLNPGVCLGDGQTEAEIVPSESGRGDAQLQRMPQHLTY